MEAGLEALRVFERTPQLRPSIEVVGRHLELEVEQASGHEPFADLVQELGPLGLAPYLDVCARRGVIPLELRCECCDQVEGPAFEREERLEGQDLVRYAIDPEMLDRFVEYRDRVEVESLHRVAEVPADQQEEASALRQETVLRWGGGRGLIPRGSQPSSLYQTSRGGPYSPYPHAGGAVDVEQDLRPPALEVWCEQLGAVWFQDTRPFADMGNSALPFMKLAFARQAMSDAETMAMTQKKAVLLGVAGSNNAFSLSLYNLKAYICRKISTRLSVRAATACRPSPVPTNWRAGRS